MMEHTLTFRKKLRKALDNRGWTVYAATQRMEGVSRQQVMNLTGEQATRDTKPHDVKVHTLHELLAAFWPDLNLDDFIGEGCLFRVIPKDPQAARRLKGYSTPG